MFTTEEEIREFFDTHDFSPYFYQTEDVTNNPPPELAVGPGRAGSRWRRPPEERLERLTVVIPHKLIAALEDLADQRFSSVDALLSAWIADRLEQEQPALARSGHGAE